MNCIMTFHDTILNISIVTDINIIQDNGILNGTITSNKYFLKDDGVLYRTIDDTSAGDQAILDLCTYIVFLPEEDHLPWSRYPDTDGRNSL